MKYLKKVIILTIVLLATTSCENEDNDYPKVFVFSNINRGDVKAYTNSGQINSSNEIDLFLESAAKRNTGNWSILGIDKNSLPNIFDDQLNIHYRGNDKIEIMSKTKARITSNDTVIYFDLIHRDGFLYFQSIDTPLTYGRDLSEPDDRPYYMKPVYFWDEPLKHYPVYTDTVNIMGITGNIKRISFKPCIYAVETKNDIQISYLSYVESTTFFFDDWDYYNLSLTAVRNIQNDINQDYILTYRNNIAPRSDTIIYQTNKVVFKRK